MNGFPTNNGKIVTILPMPRHLPPMLATLSRLPARPEDYAFEFKWDGVRAAAFWDGSSLRLESRNLIDITARYPELAPLADQLGPSPAVLDGEIIAVDSQGRVSFSQLQRRMHLADPRDIARKMREVSIVYIIFDLPYWLGRSLADRPYSLRRQTLETLQLAGPAWRIGPAIVSEGQAMLDAAKSQSLEGIIAKRLDSPYTPGRRSDLWLKIKIINSQEFVIGGYIPLAGGQLDGVGALLVGYHTAPSSALRYAGGVGTGFTDAERRDLLRLLREHLADRCPFSALTPRADAIYVEPKFVAEVEFREWTPSGTLRHPSYKGLRTDKPAIEVIREETTGY